jgi:hypothetical protein
VFQGCCPAEQASSDRPGRQLPCRWLSNHPSPCNRQQAIQKQIQNWPKETYTSADPAFEKSRQHAAAIKAYTAQEIAQGAKSGQWAAMNQKSGATLNQTANSVFPAKPQTI